MDNELEATEAIDKIDRADRAAALDLAADFPFKDGAEEVEAEEAAKAEEQAAPEKKPEPKTEAPPLQADPEIRRGSRALAELAAEKRREREAKEAERQREQRQRDLDRERDDLERERRAFAAERDRLKADPFGYAEKELGLDRSAAAERLVAGTLRPEEAKLREMLEQQAAELTRLRERYESDTTTRAKQEQEAAQRAHMNAVYSSWDGISGDKTKFPLTARLPPMVRRQYGDHVADLLAEAYPGRRFSQEEIAAQVEHDLSSDEPAGEPSSGRRDETAGANGAGKKRPPDTLTNDLASQTAGSDRELLDPSILRKNAMREAAKLKW